MTILKREEITKRAWEKFLGEFTEEDKAEAKKYLYVFTEATKFALETAEEDNAPRIKKSLFEEVSRYRERSGKPWDVKEILAEVDQVCNHINGKQ